MSPAHVSTGMRVLTVVALSLVPLLGGSQSAPRTPIVAVVGGTLVDVRTGQQHRDSIVLVEGNRIARVGTRAEVPLPQDARVVDARGRWIVPGLFDMHVHGTASPNVSLGLYLANGVTSVRDLGGGLAGLRLTREAITSGRQQGPRVFFVGPLLDGSPPVWPPMSIIVDTPMQAASTVQFLVDQGADAIKVYNRISESVLEALVSAGRRPGVSVVGHVPQAVTAQRAVELGMSGIEHAPIRSRDLIDWGALTPHEGASLASESVIMREALVWQRVDLHDGKVTALIAALASGSVFFDPTLSTDEWPVILRDESTARQHPNNRYLARAFIDESVGPEHDIFRVPSELRSVVAAGVEKRQRFVGMCQQAGVEILAGTDGPGIGVLAPGFGLHHELRLLVRAGLSPLEAIRAATLHAARALRKEALLGTIEAGKLADFVVLDADPLADIGNTTRIAAVMADGRWLDRSTLDAMLNEAERAAQGMQ